MKKEITFSLTEHGLMSNVSLKTLKKKFLLLIIIACVSEISKKLGIEGALQAVEKALFASRIRKNN